METYIRAIKKQYIARLKKEINREQKIYKQWLLMKIKSYNKFNDGKKYISSRNQMQRVF